MNAALFHNLLTMHLSLVQLFKICGPFFVLFSPSCSCTCTTNTRFTRPTPFWRFPPTKPLKDPLGKVRLRDLATKGDKREFEPKPKRLCDKTAVIKCPQIDC